MKKLYPLIALPIMLCVLTSCNPGLNKVTCYRDSETYFCSPTEETSKEYTFYSLTFNNENEKSVTVKLANFYVFDFNQKYSPIAFTNLMDQDSTGNYIFYEGESTYEITPGYQRTHLKIVFDIKLSETATLYFNSKAVNIK